MQADVDKLLLIETPENVVFGYEVAGIGSRFLAAILDTSLIGGLVLLVFLTAGMVLNAFNALENMINGGDRAAGIVLALTSVLMFAFLWGYYVFFELLWNGQSPGKRWIGLRVLGTNGRPIGISEAVIRNLVRLIDLLPGTYGIGIITMFLNDQSRRLGDFAAGTLVVYDRGAVTLESLGRNPPQRVLVSPGNQMLELVIGLPLERLDKQDIALIESFLERQHHFPNQSIIANQLIDSLFRRMEVPPRPIPAPIITDFLQAILYRQQTADSEQKAAGSIPPFSTPTGYESPGTAAR